MSKCHLVFNGFGVLTPRGTMPKMRAPSVSRHFARPANRSYPVEGHVAIKVKNGLIIGNKQSLGDEPGSTRNNDSLYNRLYKVCIRDECTD